MANKLQSDLTNLHEKLEEMNKEIKFQTKNIGVRDKIWDEMQSTMSSLKTNQSNMDRIVFNVGGTKFTTTKSTCLNCKDSIFEAIVNSDINLKEEIFIDRSPKYFSYILDFMRTGVINYKLFKKADKKILLAEAQYYQILDIVFYLEEKMRDIEFVDFEFSGAYEYNKNIAGTNKIEDIKDKECKKGICANTPGWIIIELNADWDFKELEIGGFRGNTTLWYAENGSGAQISTSLDKKTWKNVGKIPSGYGKEVKKVKLTTSNAKYIKFSYSSYLSIAYLNIVKIEEED